MPQSVCFMHAVGRSSKPAPKQHSHNPAIHSEPPELALGVATKFIDSPHPPTADKACGRVKSKHTVVRKYATWGCSTPETPLFALLAEPSTTATASRVAGAPIAQPAVAAHNLHTLGVHPSLPTGVRTRRGHIRHAFQLTVANCNQQLCNSQTHSDSAPSVKPWQVAVAPLEAASAQPACCRSISVIWTPPLHIKNTTSKCPGRPPRANNKSTPVARSATFAIRISNSQTISCTPSAPSAHQCSATASATSGELDSVLHHQASNADDPLHKFSLLLLAAKESDSTRQKVKADLLQRQRRTVTDSVVCSKACAGRHNLPSGQTEPPHPAAHAVNPASSPSHERLREWPHDLNHHSQQQRPTARHLEADADANTYPHAECLHPGDGLDAREAPADHGYILHRHTRGDIALQPGFVDTHHAGVQARRSATNIAFEEIMRLLSHE